MNNDNNRYNWQFWVGKGFLYLAFILAWIALKTVFVGLLWNWLVPDLFGGPEVTFWQALGLVVLAWLLTGGSWGKNHWGGHKHRKHWKRKWQNMSPEQREKMKQFWMSRSCGKHSPPWAKTEESSSSEPQEPATEG